MISVRQIDISDILELVPLYQSIFPEKNISEEKVQTIFKNEPATIFVAELKQCFVGFIYFLTILDEIEIIDVGVYEKFRKQGIGKKMMQHLIHQAHEKKIKKIFLEVRADNDVAIHLYELLCFTFVRSRANYYADGGEARVYEKFID